LGAAFVAGMGAGVFDAWDEIERFIEIARVIHPNTEHRGLYDEYFAVYRELYQRNQDLFIRLSQEA